MLRPKQRSAIPAQFQPRLVLAFQCCASPVRLFPRDQCITGAPLRLDLDARGIEMGASDKTQHRCRPGYDSCTVSSRCAIAIMIRAGIHGMEGCTTVVAAISWFDTFRTPRNDGPQPADALPLLGRNSPRAAGDTRALHDKNSERK